MIVVMTSCAPVLALSQPTMPPQSAPPSDAGEHRDDEVDDRRQGQAKPT